MSHYYVMIFTFKVFFLPSLRKRRPPFNECNSLDWHNSHEDGFFQSPFEANEMFCFYVTNLLFTNHKQPLKCVWQNSYLDLSSNTSYYLTRISSSELQARGTNKKTANKIKPFTGNSDSLYNLFISVMEYISVIDSF